MDLEGEGVILNLLEFFASLTAITFLIYMGVAWFDLIFIKDVANLYVADLLQLNLTFAFVHLEVLFLNILENISQLFGKYHFIDIN